MRTVRSTVATYGGQNERDKPRQAEEEQGLQDVNVAATILARVESHCRPLSSGHRPRHLGSGRSPNGLRLSGARKGVRCSRGLDDRGL